MTRTAGAQRESGPATTPVVFAFYAVLVMWLAMPFVLYGRFGQDAVPYVVAGEMVTADPHSVYSSKPGDAFTLDPQFARRSCELSPPDTDCSNLNVAFVSTPLALPFAWAVARFGSDLGVFITRLIAGLCLAGGMLLLRQRLVRKRRPDIDGALLAGALLLTPFMMVPMSLGQTSPILFLSAVLGLARTGRSKRYAAAAALVWVLAIVLKAWPAALVLIALWQRRWRFLAWSLAWTVLLTVLAGPFGPFSLVGDFLRTSSQLNGTAVANPYNGSLEALAYGIWEPLTRGPGGYVLLALRVTLVVVAWWWSGRRAGPDTQWAFGYLTLLALSPLVWWHYLWVAVAAVGVALTERRRLGREVLFLPALALVAAAISLPYANNHPWPVAQGLFLVGAIVVVGWLARQGSSRSDHRVEAAEPRP